MKAPKPDPHRSQSDDAWAEPTRLRIAGGCLVGLAQLLGALAAIAGVFALIAASGEYVWQPLGRTRQAFVFELVLAVIAAAVAAAAYAIYQHARVADIALRRTAGALVALVIAVGFGTYGVELERAATKRLIGDYCAYGAVSQAQLDGCKSHVTYDDVTHHETPAARFALDGSVDAVCGAGAGPFCHDVLDRRSSEDQRPPPY
jgi:hypothetical protein